MKKENIKKVVLAYSGEQKSGIPGISFCHASRFLITAKDKETALAACRQVLKNNGRI